MIKLIKSTFYKEKETKKKLCTFISKSFQLSMGDECSKFESNFSKFQARKYCVLVNSGSSANLAIIQGLLNLEKIHRGDLVGFSSLTWSTNVMPLIELGLNAIPIDVELNTLNVSSKTLLSVLKRYPIKMLFLTNLLGFCDDIDAIQELCKKREILLIEDNCESLGSVFKGKKLGNFGLASTFSFYVGHHMSTIEGGAICTNSEKLSTMLKLVRAHGWDRNLSLKHQTKIRNKYKVNSTFYSRYTFYNLGYNFRPTEITGYLGNIQLKFIDKIIKKRQTNFLYMASNIYSQSDKFYPIRFSHLDCISNFAFPVICKSQKIRNDLVSIFRDKIEIRPIVGGDITQQPFYNKFILRDDLYETPNSRLIHSNGFYFGNNPELTKGEIDYVLKIFKSYS